MLGVAADVVGQTAEPGRGVMGAHEIQVAVLGGTPDPVLQANAVLAFAESMRRNGIAEAPEIQSLPDRVLMTSLPVVLDNRPVIGTASETLGPVAFEPGGAFVISGPPMSGRTTALHAVAAAVARADPTLRMHYFGNSRSQLAELGVWASSTTVQRADQAVERIRGELSDGGNTALFMENLSQFIGTPADLPLQALMKQMLNDGQLVVVEGETSTLSGTTGLLAMVKASRAGLALAPDPADGTIIYRTPFPRTNAADRIPGRGFLVRAGRAELVQVALPDEP